MKRLDKLLLWSLMVALSAPTFVRAEEDEDEGQSLPRVANANWKTECASFTRYTIRACCLNAPGAS